MKLLRTFLLTSLAALALPACERMENNVPASRMESTANETAVEHAVKHLDPKYVCPMHPQIVRGEPGSCPICGMDLVLREAEPADTGERKLLYYRHPHNPTITSDKPMQDEMGMDYVPIYDDGGGVSVKISPAVENNLGVRTAEASRDRLWRRIDTVGYVDYDENRISHIHVRSMGWIEELKVKSEGERVRKGQMLFSFYSPDLVAAQEEFLHALRSGNASLVRASRERLAALGIAQRQIEALERVRKVEQFTRVYAGQDGIVSKLNAREGMYIMPQMEIMTLADLSSVWLLVEIFERQADWVRVGQYADVNLTYLPGRTWEGKVEYVYPSLNPKTRTLKVRLRFDNPDEALKPNMFANVTVYGGAKPDIVIIPREALIRTGQEERVIIAQGEGRFVPRKVKAGIESGDWVEVVEGLRSGERVVTSGQFLIDSEASLKASLQRMQSAADNGMAMPKPIIGSGVLREILPAENRLKMSHDPIPDIGWPEMTMYFPVKAGVSMDALQVEDAVQFELEETADGYVIKSIHKRMQ